jgi:hypothetical protein
VPSENNKETYSLPLLLIRALGNQTTITKKFCGYWGDGLVKSAGDGV